MQCTRLFGVLGRTIDIGNNLFSPITVTMSREIRIIGGLPEQLPLGVSQGSSSKLIGFMQTLRIRRVSHWEKQKLTYRVPVLLFSFGYRFVVSEQLLYLCFCVCNCIWNFNILINSYFLLLSRILHDRIGSTATGFRRKKKNTSKNK